MDGRRPISRTEEDRARSVDRLALIPGASLAWIGLVTATVEIRSVLFPGRGPFGRGDLDPAQIALAVGLVLVGVLVAAGAWAPRRRWIVVLDVLALAATLAAVTRLVVGMLSVSDDDVFAAVGWAAGILLLLPVAASLTCQVAEPLSEPARLRIAGGILALGLAFATIRLVTMDALSEVSLAVPASVLAVAALLVVPDARSGSILARAFGGIALVVAGALALIASLGVVVAVIGCLLAIFEEPQIGFEGASPAPALGAAGAIVVAVAGYSAELLFARTDREVLGEFEWPHTGASHHHQQTTGSPGGTSI
jgi:hypothetical protein